MADKLLCYNFDIRGVRRKDNCDLFAFDKKTDLYDYLIGLVDDLETTSICSPDGKRMVYRDSTCKYSKKGRVITGQLRTGRTGFGSDIEDSETRQKKTHKEPEDLEAITLLFMIYVPDKGLKGHLICQDHDGLNPSTCIRSYISDQFKEYFPKYRLRFNGAVFTEIIDQFVRDGELVAVELRRALKERSILDALNPDTSKIGNPYVTIRYSAGRGGKLRKSIVKQIEKIYKEKQERRFLEVDFEGAYVTLKRGGKERKLNMEQIYNNANAWPLSEEIGIDRDRIPIYVEVEKEAKEVLGLLKS